MIITISGDLGSGKSTVAKAIAEKLKLKHISAGDFMRELAAEKKMTILEIVKLAERDPSIDKEIDERTKKLAKQDNFIIDSRLAWHFIPKSLKIYLKCSTDEAAKRIFAQKRGGIEAENTTLEQTKENIIKREQSEIKRYKKYYDIDFKKEENYDFVLDTTKLTIQEAIDKVLEFIKAKQAE
ncbi:MAG: nucleoside monophosphate kinase [Candidatus Woesearchaeota archaeon]